VREMVAEGGGVAMALRRMVKQLASYAERV